MGGIVFTINKDAKSLYHAAAVIANNYLVTLHYHAYQAFKEAGLDDKIAHKIVSDLMKETFSKLNHYTHQKALTGPTQRGDVQTVKKHVNVLSSFPMTCKIYKTLGLGTLALTPHNEDKKNSIQEIFEKLI